MRAATTAVDLAKDVFEIAVGDGRGQVCDRRRLTRREFAAWVDGLPRDTVVVMEACGSAHYWGRRCTQRGAHVRLLPPQYVRPYVRRNKTDRSDAEALLEAHRCGGLQAVPVKTIEQQAIQLLHRVRQQWQKTRTARINLLRALLREHGIVVAAGPRPLQRRVAAVLEDLDAGLPGMLAPTVHAVLDELRTLDAHIRQLDRQLARIARTHPIAVRLLQIPGIGVITATALIGAVPHIYAFGRGRQFASWLGLTPREMSSGARRVLGAISKRGDRYLRTLLAHGARAVVRAAELRAHRGSVPVTRLEQWAMTILARRGRNRTTMAVANKLARIVWAVWSHDTPYEPRLLAA